MRPPPDSLDSSADPTLPARRRVDRRSIAIVLVLHALLVIALLNWRPWWPALPVAGHGTGVAFFHAPKPAQAAPTIPKPVAPVDAAASAVGTGGTGHARAGAAGLGKSGGSDRLFEDCADTPDRAMVADVFRLSRGTKSVRAMRALKPIERVCLVNLNVAPRNFHEGFPGMADLVEWFGLDVQFTVKIADAGTWDFVLLAGDGAILSIDDVDVIDNDGLHQPVPKVARVRLAAGLRRFRVRYFQGPGQAMALLLGWKKAHEKKFDYLPRNLLARPSAM